jgi:cytochrome oxidase Cu insertion factor (SCO1/SenC/PrrC family)
VYHSSYLFLIDRQGRFLDLFGYGVRAATIEGHLREYF